MSWLRFGTLAFDSLTSTILLGVITAYLLARRNKDREAWYLSGYFGGLFILLLSYTIRYSLYSPAGIATGAASNAVVFGLVCLVQFAYHSGERKFERESKIVLVLSLCGAVFVWALAFFEKGADQLYDFEAQYFTIMYSPGVGIYVLLAYLWALVVHVRKVVLFSNQDVGHESSPVSIARAVVDPRGRLAVSSRSYALLTLATTVLSLLYLLFQVEAVSRATYTLVFNLGSLLTCLIIFVVYNNSASQPVSLGTKLTGIPLAVIMVVFGLASAALMPIIHGTLGDRYRDDVSLAQIAADAGGPRRVPPSIAFILPMRDWEERLVYVHEQINTEWIERLTDEATEWHSGLIPERRSLTPQFIYLDLYDTDSFFFAYRITSFDTPYLVGFWYSQYRLQVHRFVLSILPSIAIAMALVLVGFPIAFRRGLLQPLSRLLEAVKQVTSGNFRARVPVLSEDEIGVLSRGFNVMAVSLKEAEGNFQALAENANDAILIVSEEGRFLYANARAAEVSGFTNEKLIGMHFSRLIHPDDRELIGQKLVERMNTNRDVKAYEARVIDSEGSVIPVEVTGAQTVWLGKTADVAIIRDITERKEAEEAKQLQQLALMRTDKLASIGALVAGMAHEINNPNQTISMDARFLAEGLSTLIRLAESGEQPDESVRIAGMSYPEFAEAATSAIREVGASTLRINHIVTELKRFVRGDGEKTSEATDVNEVVRVVVDLSRHLIRKATDNFSLDLGIDLPSVTGDRVGLEQVILNLLQNACQAVSSSRGGITIRSFFDRSAEMVIVEVEDEGDGIGAEELTHVTEPFYTTRQSSGGTGLGLSVSLRIVRDHGGTLELASVFGRGTTAKMRLPAD